MKRIPFLLLLVLAGTPLLALGAESQSFVPLTSLPGIKDFSGQSSLPTLLNNIYKIAIGAAAVLAVLQIMRAGILYMGGDSVTEKKEAKSLLGMAIGGLLLVLSPVIVFSIINPKILDLQIGTIQLNQLGSPSNEDGSAPGGGGSATTPPTTYHYKALVGQPATNPTCAKEFKVENSNFKTLAECTADMNKNNTDSFAVIEDCSGKPVSTSSSLKQLPRCTP